MSERIADILDKAAEVIDERGWFRGHYTDPCGRGVCLVGAVSVAAGLTPDALGKPGLQPRARIANAHNAISKFERWLETDLDITDWNDEVAEDSAEVIAALREVAAAERERTS